MSADRAERPRAFLLFHLNLGFSTLEVADRPTVIERCYGPMLDLVGASGRRIAVEASGWTLARIAVLAPRLMDRLRGLITAGRIEFVGSGWAQVIGPLAPPQVNRWNQSLGRDAYREMLGVEPAVALVNEMAFSAGLVDTYAGAGYRALVLDRENARAALGIEHLPAHVAPPSILGPGGAELPVVWSDTVLFQRFQRVVHGEISTDEYLAAIQARVDAGQSVLPLYTNDVEVFGHRPGRFMTEAALDEGEWKRVAKVLDAVDERFGVEWVTPSGLLDNRELLEEDEGELSGHLTSAAHPVLVKKQRKYNINRWALSGRDDLRLNTVAHRVAQRAAEGDDATKQDACEWWASDLRTHLAPGRWERLRERLDAELAAPTEGSGESKEEHRFLRPVLATPSDGSAVVLRSDSVTVEMDPRRGGTLRTVAFRSHGSVPCLGTLAQGRVPAIDVAADFYTGGVVVDLPGLARRVTDLEPREIEQVDGSERLGAATMAGRWPDGRPLVRTTVHVPADGTEAVLMRFDLGSQRPRGSVRVGHLTLLPDAFQGSLWVETTLGGRTEHFPLDRDADHGQPVSLLVSSETSLGGGRGEVRIGDYARALRVTWDPSACAAVPMLHHRRVGLTHLTRLWFSLAELDDTFRDGGTLLPFEMRIEPSLVTRRGKQDCLS